MLSSASRRGAQCAFELDHGLPMGGQLGRTSAGRRCMLKHKLAVPGRLCVVGQPSIVVASRRRAGGPGSRGVLDGAVRRNRRLHCHPGDLVPEPQSVDITDQDAGATSSSTAVGGAWVTACKAAGSIRTPIRAAVSSTRRVSGSRPPSLASTASRTDEGSVSSARLQHFADIERVSAGDRGAARPGPSSCPLPSRRPPTRRGVAARCAGSISRWTPRRRRSAGSRRGQALVAIRDQDQCSRATDPRPEVAQQVERRLIRPVRVLDDQHGEWSGAASKVSRASNTRSRRAPARQSSSSSPPA